MTETLKARHAKGCIIHRRTARKQRPCNCQLSKRMTKEQIEKVRKALEVVNHPLNHPDKCLQAFMEPNKGPCVCGIADIFKAFKAFEDLST